jgi:hypothetical protein
LQACGVEPQVAVGRHQQQWLDTLLLYRCDLLLVQ